MTDTELKSTQNTDGKKPGGDVCSSTFGGFEGEGKETTAWSSLSFRSVRGDPIRGTTLTFNSEGP